MKRLVSLLMAFIILTSLMFYSLSFSEESIFDLDQETTADLLPVNQMINLFAYTNANANMRLGPSSDTKKIAAIKKGTYAYLIENGKNAEERYGLMC